MEITLRLKDGEDKTAIKKTIEHTPYYSQLDQMVDAFWAFLFSIGYSHDTILGALEGKIEEQIEIIKKGE